MRTKKATIKDVAQRAGVGVGTVSRVLNGSGQVSDATREKIHEAIAHFGFRPNAHARSLPVDRRVMTVGVLVPFFTGHSFIERLRGVQRAVNEATSHFNLLLYNFETPEDYREQITRIMRERVVEGLLNMSLPVSYEDAQLLDRLAIPIVHVGADKRESAEFSLDVDNRHGGALATQHLLSLGHRRIAYVGDQYPDEFGFLTSQNRHHGYQQALKAAGVPVNPAYTRLDKPGHDVARLNCLQLLDLAEPPTAIFAMSDIQALGCVAALRERGLRVPEDVSVIGFDNIEISGYANLTTISQHLETSGYLGMRYLLSLIQPDSAPVEPPHLPDLEVVVRQTTAPLSLES